MQPINETIRGIGILQKFLFRISDMSREGSYPINILIVPLAEQTWVKVNTCTIKKKTHRGVSRGTSRNENLVINLLWPY